jgi:pSer/pThr/pTyr-binding forkhead associated (FHA) protein
MPPIFLLAVKVAFLIVLYLFVARAIRAVVIDVFGPKAERRRTPAYTPRATARPAPARSPRRLPRELVITDASGRRTIPLKESITLGRAATSDLVIADNYVSNVHARIYLRDGSYWLEDLGSTNGTYMNRSRVSTPTAIGPGDDIRMGKATLELRR